MLKKTAIVTGATSGIGFETVKSLLAQQFYVIATGRDSQKCIAAQNILKNEYGDSITYIVCDQSELKKTAALANDIKDELNKKGYDKIDVLINNAGTYTSKRAVTPENFETQYAVNYLSVFLLTNLLLPLLLKSSDARVLSVSSASHYNTRIKWQVLNHNKIYNGLSAYKQSKLAIVLMTNALNQQLYSENFAAYTVDPGLVNTSIGQKSSNALTSLFWKVRRKLGVSVKEGAKTSVYLATKQNREELVTYSYFYLCKPKRPNRLSLKNKNISRYWQLSKDLCKVYLS